jgi:adenylosuccinate synthase
MPCTIVLGAQWGDEGKGKIVDLLAAEHDWVVRYQGGPNAGHSVIHEGQTVVLHLVPSGVLHPAVRCAIGNGVVVDPEALVGELAGLARLGVRATGRLLLSAEAHVIRPYHRAAEREREAGPAAIGTTQRGIGPAYEDKAARVGVRVGDLLDREALATGVAAVRARTAVRLAGAGDLPSAEAVTARCLELGRELAPYIADTRVALWDALERGERVLLEGAQGTLLDLDHGTYPFVTSSSAAAGGGLTGTGIGPRRIDRVVGVAKAYATRVGLGPFPTELVGEMGEHLREEGAEYGATTGRARRCGWLDAVALRYAARLNGLDELMITKLDVLDGLDRIAVAVGYRDASGRPAGFAPAAWQLAACRPVYEWHEGWQSLTRAARGWTDLPERARAYLARVSELAGVPVSRVSVGPEREATLAVPPPGRGTA